MHQPAPTPIRARRLVLTIIAATAILVSVFATAPAARASTTSPIDVKATSASTSSIDVTWSAASTVGTAGWSIHLTDSAGRTWPGTAACKDCRAATIDGLLAGMQYKVQVVGYGGTPIGLGSTTVTVQAGSCAGVGGSCVTIGSGEGDPISHVAQGILHGTTVKSDLEKAAALNPKSWRIAAGDFARFARAREIGGSITALLSDPWAGWAERHGMAGQNPWGDWDKYREYVAGVVRYHISAGMLPDYWEVQNEPDYATQYTASPAASRALILEQFKVAHDAIRSVLPEARIVGPSLSQYRYGDPAAPIDLVSFLDFVDANDLQYDVAWHELGNSLPGTITGDPKSTVSHVQSVRAAIADRGLTDVEIHINEYGARWHFDQPGSHVGYMAALETSDVHVANMACWPITDAGTTYSTCFSDPGLLDGLITPLGLESDTYAVHEDYAAMVGRHVQTSTTDMWTSATSARDSEGTVRSLIGRHESCTVVVDAGCHAGLKVAPAGQPVTIALDMACRGNYDVRVQLIANVPNSVPALPATVAAKRMKCGSAGMIKLPALTDGSAYSVVADPR